MAKSNKIDMAHLEKRVDEFPKSKKGFEKALEFLSKRLKQCKQEDDCAKMFILVLQGKTYFLESKFIKNKWTKSKIRLPERKRQDVQKLLEHAEDAFNNSELVCRSITSTNNDVLKSKACLFYNKGLFLLEINSVEEGLKSIEEALEIYKKLLLKESKSSSHLKQKLCDAWFFLYEYKAKDEPENAEKNLDEIIDFKYSPAEMRCKAVKEKAMILMRQGNFKDATQFLLKHQQSWRLEEDEVAKYLKAAIVMTTLVEHLSETSDPTELMNLYEICGDITVRVKLFDKAIDYYKDMLHYAKQIKNNKKISEANVSVYETLQDCRRYSEAIPYAKEELDKIIKTQNPLEIARMALCYGYVLHGANTQVDEIPKVNNLALEHAQKANNLELELNIVHVIICNFTNFGVGDPNILPDMVERKKQLKSLLNLDESDDENDDEEDSDDKEDNEAEDVLKYLNKVNNNKFKLDALEEVKSIIEAYNIGEDSELFNINKEIKKLGKKIGKARSSKSTSSASSASTYDCQIDDAIDLAVVEETHDQFISPRKSEKTKGKLKRRRSSVKNIKQSVSDGEEKIKDSIAEDESKKQIEESQQTNHQKVRRRSTAQYKLKNLSDDERMPESSQSNLQKIEEHSDSQSNNQKRKENSNKENRDKTEEKGKEESSHEISGQKTRKESRDKTEKKEKTNQENINQISSDTVPQENGSNIESIENSRIEEIIHKDKDIEKLYASLVKKLEKKTGIKDFKIIVNNKSESGSRKRSLSSGSTPSKHAKQRKLNDSHHQTEPRKPSSSSSKRSSTQPSHDQPSSSLSGGASLDEQNTTQIIKDLTDRLAALEKVVMMPWQSENYDVAHVKCEIESQDENSALNDMSQSD